MHIYFIRHGKTRGNLEKRYIGVTEEPLCTEGKKELQEKEYPEVERVFASPRIRCLETAALLYPKQEVQVVEKLAECDFGEFEGKQAKELIDNPRYHRWIESAGNLPFPKGEGKLEFTKRVLEGFEEVLKEAKAQKIETMALIVHGGTIMSILEVYGIPKKDFYDFQVKNGEGYELVLERGLTHPNWRHLGFDSRGSTVDVSSSARNGLDDRENGESFANMVSEK